MTLRRKLAVTTIAASVAMSAFAGIPLSSKGLSEKLGLSGVAYATSLSDLVSKADKLYDELEKIDGGVTAVTNLKNELNAALSEPGNEIIANLVDKISKEDAALEPKVESLIGDLLSNVLPSDAQAAFDSYTAAYVNLVKDIRDEHGLTALTAQDLASVILEIQTKFANLLVDFNLNNILTIKAQLKNAANEAIATNANVQALATAAGITGEDFADIYIALQDSPQVNFSTLLVAYDKLNQAYKNAFPTTSPETPDTPNTTAPPTTIEIPAEVKALETKFAALKEQLAKATDEEKAELIAKAVEEAQAVVDKLSNIEATVKEADGKATLQLDDKKALSAIAGIAAAAAALKDATGEEIKSLKVKIDLGNVEQDEVAVGLSTAVVEEAIKAELAAVAFVIDDLTIELPVGGQFNKAVDLEVKRSEPSSVITTGGASIVSPVYDFSVNIGGQPVTQFTKPVLIQLPVDSSNDIDTDLLTLAKIINDKLAYYGGRYSNGKFTEARDSFSSYVVVENKVSFDDTADVEAWAGRAIEVIAAKGAINGKSEGVFDPSSNVTRAEFAKMLVHALDLDNLTSKEKFADVNAGDWFAPYVAAASEKGIINGRSATKFDPSAKITRAEMATMVTRALKYAHGTADVADLEEALAGFSDASQISDALAQGVAFAANYGIVIGNEGKFAPNANATRAQAAVIIYRAFNFEG